MPVVVRILQPANDGSGRTDLLRQFTLREAGFSAQFVDLARDLGVENLFFVFFDALRIMPNITVVRVP
jgi:hypothetical protein